VAEGVRLVTTEEATLYGAIVAGTFTLLGVMIERLLRLIGRVRCEASASALNFFGSPDEGVIGRTIPWYELDEKAAEIAILHNLSYRVGIDFYNGKEAPSGLRDVRVELVLDRGKRFVDRPMDMRSPATATPGRMPRKAYDALEVVNLPPRQFVHEELSGSFGKAAAEACKDREWRIEFVAQRPKRPLLWRKTYRKTITKP
jgi:hypothetical protein